MPLPFHCGEVDAGDTGDGDIIERQVSNQSDLGRPVVALQRAQIGTIGVDGNADLGPAPGIGEHHQNLTERDRFLDAFTRLVARA